MMERSEWSTTIKSESDVDENRNRTESEKSGGTEKETPGSAKGMFMKL